MVVPREMKMSNYIYFKTEIWWHTDCAKKSFEKAKDLKLNWQRGRDSNPRYAMNVYTLSRRAT